MLFGVLPDSNMLFYQLNNDKILRGYVFEYQFT